MNPATLDLQQRYNVTKNSEKHMLPVTADSHYLPLRLLTAGHVTSRRSFFPTELLFHGFRNVSTGTRDAAASCSPQV